MIRYRTGVDARTGKVLRGRAHLDQSIAKIVTTAIGERVMRLDFGCGLVRQIGRNIHAAFLLHLYGDLIAAVHRWEPEARIKHVRLVSVERTGGYAFAIGGLYFPEGRFGNYEISETMDARAPLVGGGVV